MKFPNGSFGNHLGAFLNENGFELIPKVERHDAYHVLTGFDTKVEDEIALQYLCYGNGKRTPYLFAVLILGTFLLPEYLNNYRNAYHTGKSCNTFHYYDFKKLLGVPLMEFQAVIFSEKQLRNLKQSPL